MLTWDYGRMRAVGMCEVIDCPVGEKRMDARGNGRRDGKLGETSLSYLRNVIESSARPLALLYQIFPERLRTEKV